MKRNSALIRVVFQSLPCIVWTVFFLSLNCVFIPFPVSDSSLFCACYFSLALTFYFFIIIFFPFISSPSLYFTRYYIEEKCLIKEREEEGNEIGMQSHPQVGGLIMIKCGVFIHRVQRCSVRESA